MNKGDRTTPTYVAFTDAELVIGTGAISHTNINPSNIVFDAKRLIGRRFPDLILMTVSGLNVCVLLMNH
jgi:heat shock protein 1/8